MSKKTAPKPARSDNDNPPDTYTLHLAAGLVRAGFSNEQIVIVYHTHRDAMVRTALDWLKTP